MSINVLALARRAKEERRRDALPPCGSGAGLEVGSREGGGESSPSPAPRGTWPTLPTATVPSVPGAATWSPESFFPVDPARVHLLPTPQPRIRYVPNAMDADTERALLAWLDAPERARHWVALKARRLQVWGGTVTSAGLVDAAPLPTPLACAAEALTRAGAFPPHAAPNHVLINEYLPGQGILPHTDGPAYYPRVATWSCGTTAIMRVASTDRVPLGEVILARRSCVLFDEEVYHACLHSIADVGEEVVGAYAPVWNRGPLVPRDDNYLPPPTASPSRAPGGSYELGDVIDRGRRISFTFRHVPVAPGPLTHAASATEGMAPT